MHESIAHFVVRVRCRRKESSRSLSHLLMSFLLFKYASPLPSLLVARIFFHLVLKCTACIYKKCLASRGDVISRLDFRPYA